MPTVAIYVHEICTVVGRQSFPKIKTEKLRSVLVLGREGGRGCRRGTRAGVTGGPVLEVLEGSVCIVNRGSGDPTAWRGLGLEFRGLLSGPGRQTFILL